MKLVLTYMITDGYTYASDIVLPFEYESLEKAEFDLLEQWERKREERAAGHIERFNNIKFASMEIDYAHLIDYEKGKESYKEPQILTLEDWFESYKPGGKFA